MRRGIIPPFLSLSLSLSPVLSRHVQRFFEGERAAERVFRIFIQVPTSEHNEFVYGCGEDRGAATNVNNFLGIRHTLACSF